MGNPFDIRHCAELDAAPEEVWNAIATGPGIDSWFLGRSVIEPKEGGAVRTQFPGYSPESRIRTWQPGKRLEHATTPSEDGSSVAYEFLIEGHSSDATVLRLAVSGFLPDDDWQDEYDEFENGLELFFRTLVEYLSAFPGRTATPITAFSPRVDNWPRTWARLHNALALSDTVDIGDVARVVLPDGRSVTGSVYCANADALGIRTRDALFRFLSSTTGVLVAAHHVFSRSDRSDDEPAWSAWLAELLASPRTS